MEPKKEGPAQRFVTVPMSAELYGRLADLAEANRRSMANFVRLLIERAPADEADAGLRSHEQAA